MPRIYLSLGSNVDPESNLELAIGELGKRFGELEVSPVYRNKAVGFEGDDFLNLVVGCKTEDSIDDILEVFESIHHLAGRERGEEKFSARPLDIDLLLYGDTVATSPVALPRPDVLRYSFVLKPLADIAPTARHPETGQSFDAHWREMAADAHPLHRVPFLPGRRATNRDCVRRRRR